MELVISPHAPPAGAPLVPWTPTHGWIGVGVALGGLGLLLITLLYYTRAYGPSCARAAQIHPKGAEGLLKFLKTPSIRAVPHRGDRLGDVCDKKDINMEKAAIGGERRFPLVGLRADTSSEQAQPILSQGPAPLEVSDTEDDLTFGPHPVAYQGYEGFATGAFPGFPPSPPRQEASEKEPKGPWWREMLASPVKRLKLTGWASPWKENPPRLDLPPAEPEITHVEGTKATTAQKPTTAKANDRSRPKPHRLDLAPRKTGLMQRKCSRSHAVGLPRIRPYETGRWQTSWHPTTPIPPLPQRTRSAEWWTNCSKRQTSTFL